MSGKDVNTKTMKDLHGRKFTVTFRGEEITGVVSIQDNGIYLCQNVRNGSDCSNKFGYKYSYWIGSNRGSLNDVDDGLFENFKLKVMEMNDITVGTKLYDDDGEQHEAIFRSGELVILKNGNEYASMPYTIEELKDRNFKLKIEPCPSEPVELTMDEIAEKFGVPISQLKIKK